ncbi:hypothetical protein B0T16DRAFT_427103 [Cercophora newfieldiana]|uniref:Peptidase M3A/M3B catalytic domain-containing protein n=1 Tax=Cercophora newfieldiana TaxID=92897 RepID=A0AA40CVC0_9PEZI|nr:hypothetical protein B0T16DRAFT_427103 [Cercophora newfieldiana]
MVCPLEMVTVLSGEMVVCAVTLTQTKIFSEKAPSTTTFLLPSQQPNPSNPPTMSPQAKAKTPPQPPLHFTLTPSLLQTAHTLINTYRSAQDAIVSSVTPATATFATVLLPFAHAENAFLTGRRSLSLYKDVSASPDLREASRKASDMLDAFGLEFKQRLDLFVLIDAVVKRGEVLDPEEEHLLSVLHRDMTKTGINLPAEERARFGEIQARVLELGSRFAENARAPSKPVVWFAREELAGVPKEDLERMQKGEGENEGKVGARIAEHYHTVMRSAESAAARRKMYMGYYNRCNENVPIFKEVAVLRDEAARMLGYRNHASLVCEERMARDTETVDALLGRLREGLLPGAEGAMERYRREKERDFEERGEEWDGVVYAWDLNYYGRRATARAAGETRVDLKEVSDWFPLQVMVEGMLETMGKLFGLVFTEVEFEEGGREELVWRDDVRLFSVWDSEDEGGEFLGYLYLDLYSHEYKSSGSWCSSLMPGHLKPDGSRAYTSVALMCEFDRPTSTKPCLLSHMDATMMFHELGHGIHDLVSKTRFGRFHGCNGTVIDFGEAPSQVLENWFLIPSQLKRWSRHYSSLSDEYLKIWREKKAAALGMTGSAIEEISPPDVHLPDDMIEAFLEKRSSDSVILELGQLAISTWDFMIHSQESHEAIKNLNFSESYNRLAEGLNPAATPSDLGEGWEWGHAYCVWTMLVQGDYHAGYYSYALSKVYSADIFDNFFRDDPMSATQGRRYRYGLLEPGGRRPEMETLLAFFRSMGIA